VLLTYATGPAAAVAIVWLQRADLIAPTPLWIVFALLVSTSLTNLAARIVSEKWQTTRARQHLRLAVSALTTAAVLYAAGWGPVVVIAFVVGVADVMKSEGSTAWLPGFGWCAVALAIGETLVALEWAPSLLRPAESHAVAIVALVCLGLVVHTLGVAARNAEVARERIRVDREQFHDLIRHGADVIGLVGADGRIKYINPGIERMLGIDLQDAIGSEFRSLMDGADRMAFDEMCGRLDLYRPESCEIRMQHRNGSARRISTTVTLRSDATTVVNLHDVTVQRELEDRLRHQAFVDALTGLPNRPGLIERIGLMSNDGPLAVLFVDLDGFKEINDEFGHERGDQVLIEAATRIARSVPADTVVGRLGGDEFLAARPYADEASTCDIARAIVDALRAPLVDLPDRRIGGSVGVAWSREGEDLDSLIRRADVAMYEAKCADSDHIVVATG
jgi:diguanylate cyclase (GGDEF)-like protein/PAS domain S-box-containing protein